MANETTILLLGTGPRLAWVRGALEAMRARLPESLPAFHVIDAQPTRELLVLLSGHSALVLVDPIPFAGGPPPQGVPIADAVRAEAQRAIFALELSRRAVRTV